MTAADVFARTRSREAATRRTRAKKGSRTSVGRPNPRMRSLSLQVDQGFILRKEVEKGVASVTQEGLQVVASRPPLPRHVSPSENFLGET